MKKIIVASGMLLLLTVELVIAQEKKINDIEPKLNRYFNDAYKLSFKYPSSWPALSPEEVIKKSKGQFVPDSNAIVFFINERDFDKNINIGIFNISKSSMTANEWQQVALFFDREYPKQFSGFKKISSKVLNISGVDALEYVYDTKRINKPFRQKSVTIVKNKRNYVLTFTSPRESYKNSDEECFQVIISTLKIN